MSISPTDTRASQCRDVSRQQAQNSEHQPGVKGLFWVIPIITVPWDPECKIPWPPEPGTQGVSPGMLLQKHLIQNKNKNRLSDIYKSSTPRNTGMWNMAEGKHKDGPHQFLCPSRRRFTISKSVSFLYSLGTFQTSVTWSKKVCIQALPERSPVPPLGLVEASMILKARCFAALSLRSYS